MGGGCEVGGGSEVGGGVRWREEVVVEECQERMALGLVFW